MAGGREELSAQDRFRSLLAAGPVFDDIGTMNGKAIRCRFSKARSWDGQKICCI